MRKNPWREMLRLLRENTGADPLLYGRALSGKTADTGRPCRCFFKEVMRGPLPFRSTVDGRYRTDNHFFTWLRDLGFYEHMVPDSTEEVDFHDGRSFVADGFKSDFKQLLESLESLNDQTAPEFWFESDDNSEAGCRLRYTRMEARLLELASAWDAAHPNKEGNEDDVPRP